MAQIVYHTAKGGLCRAKQLDRRKEGVGLFAKGKKTDKKFISVYFVFKSDCVLTRL